jgi:hypothetical protein
VARSPARRQQADALILDIGAAAYSHSREREHEAAASRIATMDMALEGLAANAFWSRPDAPPRRRGSRRCGGRRSFLRHSGLAQAFENALKLGQIFRVGALRRPEATSAGDGEARVEREAGLYRGTRAVKPPKLRQSGG